MRTDAHAPSDSPRVHDGGRWEWRDAAPLAAALLLSMAALAAAPAYGFMTDDFLRFQQVESLACGLAPEPSKYSLLGPALTVPWYWISRAAGSAELFLRFNWLLLALAMAAFLRLLPPLVGARNALAFCLLLATSSMFCSSVRGYYAETLSALLAGVGMALLARGRPTAGWPLLVLGCVNTPAASVGLALVVSRRALVALDWRPLLALPACATLILADNRLRLGAWLTTGYEGDRGMATFMPYSGLPGFSHPMLLGVACLLFSFGKGLAYFAPGLFFAPSAARAAPLARGLMADWTLFLAGLVLVYAKWWAWYGGWCFGPRFLLFASLPASLALACRRDASGGTLAGDCALLASLALSAWVGVCGALFGLDNLELCLADNFRLECLTWHVPEFSVLWRPLIVHRPLDWRDALLLGCFAAGFAAVAGPVASRVARKGRRALRTFARWRGRALMAALRGGRPR